MGQLQLYPKLLPKLGEHKLVLLLPDLPHPALVEAIAKCDVHLHAYSLPTSAGKIADFDEGFLRLCGLI